MSNKVINTIFIDPNQVPALRAIISNAVVAFDNAYKHNCCDPMTYAVIVEKLQSCRDWIAFIDALCSKKFDFTDNGVTVLEIEDSKLSEFLNNQNFF